MRPSCFLLEFAVSLEEQVLPALTVGSLFIWCLAMIFAPRKDQKMWEEGKNERSQPRFVCIGFKIFMEGISISSDKVPHLPVGARETKDCA